MAQSTQERIDQAFKQKELFYKPWIGIQYDEGIQLDESIPFKLLVIGASRYCEYSNKREQNEKSLCPHLNDCAFCCDYDRLMSIAKDCPFVNDSDVRGNTHKGYCLYDINKASILRSFYESSLPTAYSTFQEVLNKRAQYENPKDIWKHVAFFNYCQPIVWGNEKGKRTPTPYYDEKPILYTNSKPTVEKLISLLSPDLIFLWQSKPLKDSFDKLFPAAKLRNESISPKYKNGKSKEYPTYSLKVEDKDIILCPTPHPTNTGISSSYYGQVNALVSHSSFMTINSFSNLQYAKPKEEDLTWDDFDAALDYLLIDNFYNL